MRRNIRSGIVKQIEPVHKYLTFVTLLPIDTAWAESRIPVYMDLSQGYIGRVVDVIIERKGFLEELLCKQFRRQTLRIAPKCPIR